VKGGVSGAGGGMTMCTSLCLKREKRGSSMCSEKIAGFGMPVKVWLDY
jgi:hypothetical protein